jgi:hypothetical protein
MKGVGIIFDIDGLGGGFYGAVAWRIFMHNLNPGSIKGCSLKEGDTNETIYGKRREYCIAVLGENLDEKAINNTRVGKGIGNPKK